jgi:arylsulfatase A-like enzyme
MTSRTRPGIDRKPNIVLLITDQQSGNPHWPAGWAEANLPAMSRLRETGLTFTNGYTNSCTCSPSRTTLFTGLYPAQHGALEVLECDNSGIPDPEPPAGGPTVAGAIAGSSLLVKERRQRGLSSQLQNLAKILHTAGYHVAYKGKWHLTKPVQYSLSLGQKYWTDADRDHLSQRYGFHDWTMPDAGDNLKIANMGGGRINNDGRFVDGSGQSAKYGYSIPKDVRERESVLHFLKTYDGDAPFCLIVSLVNPHDVLAYPGTGGALVTLNDGTQIPCYKAAGYHDRDFDSLPIEPPATVDESLDTKPAAQAQFRVLSNQGNGQIGEDDYDLQRGYCQFYAYLCQEADKHLGRVLDALAARPGGMEDTVIFRIADHGDMAMAHGRQRQKMFNVYQETLNIPFIVSNPVLFPKPETTGSFASLIDILPTLATLGGVPDRERWTFKGRDLTPILEDPRASVQDFIHFTYDDLYFYVPSPNHIRCLVEDQWKYAVYYDIYTGRAPEYEMYHRETDPLETRNLAHPDAEVPAALQGVIQAERQRLHHRLTQVMEDLGTTPDTIVWPEVSGGDAFVSTDLPDRKVDPEHFIE